jgi:hypothetical protein
LTRRSELFGARGRGGGGSRIFPERYYPIERLTLLFSRL